MIGAIDSKQFAMKVVSIFLRHPVVKYKLKIVSVKLGEKYHAEKNVPKKLAEQSNSAKIFLPKMFFFGKFYCNIRIGWSSFNKQKLVVIAQKLEKNNKKFLTWYYNCLSGSSHLMLEIKFFIKNRNSIFCLIFFWYSQLYPELQFAWFPFLMKNLISNIKCELPLRQL